MYLFCLIQIAGIEQTKTENKTYQQMPPLIVDQINIQRLHKFGKLSDRNILIFHLFCLNRLKCFFLNYFRTV